MTKDDVIRLAIEAGWKDLRNYDSEMHEFLVMGSFKDLETFAKLVAEHEREACAKVADELVGQDLEHNFSALIAHNIRARGEK